MLTTSKRENGLTCFFRPELQVKQDVLQEGGTMSPSKPTLVMNRLLEISAALGALDAIRIQSFEPFDSDKFLIAHAPDYVRAFFAGDRPLCEANEIPWTPQLAEAVRYTNASLAAAQEHALNHPEQICFSPTSGFHHAKPTGGFEYCTFSGQVISAVELYRKYGVAGAWIDLDAHFGNSIEDSREFVPDLNQAIPVGCNINPVGMGQEYLLNLTEQLANLKQRILSGEITWLAFAQGTDTHHADDFIADPALVAEGRLSTTEWLEASKIVYEWISQLDRAVGKPIPLTIALFGGYRSDDYQTVTDLHVAHLLTAMQVFDPQNPRWKNFEIVSSLN
jgi:hypothetical protein